MKLGLVTSGLPWLGMFGFTGLSLRCVVSGRKGLTDCQEDETEMDEKWL